MGHTCCLLLLLLLLLLQATLKGIPERAKLRSISPGGIAQ
jgi:hypothetical protein